MGLKHWKENELVTELEEDRVELGVEWGSQSSASDLCSRCFMDTRMEMSGKH